MLHRVKARRDAFPSQRLGARQYQDGNRVGIRLRHPGERVLDTGLSLNDADPHSPSDAGTAGPVGDVHGYPLGASHDRPYAGRDTRVDQRSVRKATEMLSPLGAQDVRDRVDRSQTGERDSGVFA
jgi:hypothetical protein